MPPAGGRGIPNGPGGRPNGPRGPRGPNGLPGAGPLLLQNLLIYGVGGIIVPFAGIKAIDLAVTALHLA